MVSLTKFLVTAGSLLLSSVSAQCVAGSTISIAPASVPNGNVGIAYSQTFTASGGQAPYTYAVTSPPPGLTFTVSTLSGTPNSPGTYAFTVTSTDAAGCSGTMTYQMAICGTITVAPATLPGGTTGTAYSAFLSASGGSGSYSFAITGGALPRGLRLDGSQITGTPSLSASFTFTITATDSSGICSGSRSYTLTIACGPLSIAPGTLPNAVTNYAYSQQITVSGGIGPYSYSLSGALPLGLTLSASGIISGTPDSSSTGSYTFTVQAADPQTSCNGNSNSVSKQYTLTVNCVQIAPTSPLFIRSSAPYRQPFSYTGGKSPFVTSISGLPPGFRFNLQTLSGPANAVAAGIDVTVSVNVQGRTCSQTFSYVLSFFEN